MSHHLLVVIIVIVKVHLALYYFFDGNYNFTYVDTDLYNNLFDGGIFPKPKLKYATEEIKSSKSAECNSWEWSVFFKELFDEAIPKIYELDWGRASFQLQIMSYSLYCGNAVGIFQAGFEF